MKQINFKKIGNLFMLTLLVASLFIVPISNAEFSDIRPDHWCYNKIMDFEGRGYISGYLDGTVLPDGKITRAEYVTIVNNFFGYEPKAEIGDKFSDVTANDWFAPYVAEAVERGYISGYPDGTFKPEDPIRRQEATVILSRILKIHEEEYAKSNPDGLTQYKDGEQIDDWAYKAIHSYSVHNFINGYEDGTIQLFNNVTRAETVQLLNTVEEKVVIDRENKTTTIKHHKSTVATPVISVVENNDKNLWYNATEAEDGKITVKVNTTTSGATISVKVGGKDQAVTVAEVATGTEVSFELADGDDIKIDAIATRSGYYDSTPAALTVRVDTIAPIAEASETNKGVKLLVDDSTEKSFKNSGVDKDTIRYAWFTKVEEDFVRPIWSNWEAFKDNDVISIPENPGAYYLGVNAMDNAENVTVGKTDKYFDDEPVVRNGEINYIIVIEKEVIKPSEIPKIPEELKENEGIVTFFANNGTDKIVKQLFEINVKKELLANTFLRAGYKFLGWSETIDGEVKYENKANYTLTSVDGASLFAVWTKNEKPIEVKTTHTVTYTMGDKGNFKTQTTSNVLYGEATPLFVGEMTGLDGYTFSAWNPTVEATVTANAEYVATWTANTNTKYTVNFYEMTVDGAYSDTATRVDATRTGTTDTVANVTVEDKEPATGFTFDTENTNNVLSGTVAGNGSLVLKVYFKRTAHTVTYTKGDKGNFETQTTSNVLYGEATPVFVGEKTGLDGYTFSAWNPTVADTVTANAEYEATWTANDQTLTFEYNGATAGNTELTRTVKTDAKLGTLPAPEKTGYTFAGWYNEGTFATVATADTVMPASTKTIYANWTANTDTEYTVEHYKEDLNADTYTLADTDNLAGTTAEATNAVAKTYTGFTAQAFEQATIAVDGSTVVKINYTRNSYNVVYKVDGAEKYTDIYEYEATVTARADETKTGYTFSGWSAIPATMPANDVTVVGTFAINSYNLTINYVCPTGVTAPAKHTSLVEYNKAYSVASPAVTGYTANVETVAGTMPADDVEVTVTYSANTDTKYKVEHYKEDLKADTYTLADTDNLAGTTAEATNAVAKTYTGFTAQAFEQTTIAADGSTVVRINYTRNSYNVVYKVDGAEKYTDIYEYEATVTARGNETKTGYTFSGWSTIPETMPANDVTVVGTFNVNSYNLTVNYVCPEGVTAPAKHTSLVEYNKAYSVASPAVTGYTANVKTVAGTMPADDVEVTVTYSANTDTEYKVEHYKEDLKADTYTLADTDNLAGTTAETTNAVAKTYTGFTAQAFEQATIAADGSTVVRINYTRNSYNVVYKVDGAEKYTDIYEYEATVTARADETNTGYTFSGWSTIPETMPANDVTVVGTFNVNSYNLTVNYVCPEGVTAPAKHTSLVEYNKAYSVVSPAVTGYTANVETVAGTMPAEAVEVTVTYSANTDTKYKVEHYLENANGTYSIASTLTEAKAGTTDTTAIAEAKIVVHYTENTTHTDRIVEGNIAGDGSLVLKLYYDRDSYTITFNSNGGSAVAPITQKHGTAVIKPTDPTRAGYTFVSWEEAVPATMPTANTTCVAKWTATEQTVSYKYENTVSNAPAVPSSTKHATDTEVTVVANPTLAGYTFTGWTTTNTKVADGKFTMPASNVEFTGRWNANTDIGYTVEYETAGGTKLLADKVVENQTMATTVTETAEEIAGYTVDKESKSLKLAAEGNVITFIYKANADTKYKVEHYLENLDGSYPTTPEDTDNLKGTTGASTEAEASSYTGFKAGEVKQEVIDGNGSTVVRINYTRNSYNLVYKVDGTQCGVTENYKYETSVTPREKETKTGYTFNGWNGTVTKMPARDVEVTGTFTVNKYTISFNTDGGTEISAITKDYGAVVTAPADPTKTGYTFDGWDKEIPTTMPAENITITASWEINQYTATFVLNNGEANVVRTQNYGTALEAPVPTKTGYTFKAWNKTVPATMPAENTTYEAQWTINKYTVTWKNENGTTLETDKDVPYGTIPTFNKTAPTKTATAQYSYTFKGWDPEIVAVSGDATYTATYNEEVNQYTYTFYDENGTTELKKLTVEYGTVIVEPAEDPEKAPTAQYTFEFAGYEGFTKGMTISKDISFKAKYNKTVNKYTVTWKNENGSILETDTEVEYGTMPEFNGTKPTKASSGSYTYTFDGWSPNVSTVKGNITYTATFESVWNAPAVSIDSFTSTNVTNEAGNKAEPGTTIEYKVVITNHDTVDALIDIDPESRMDVVSPENYEDITLAAGQSITVIVKKTVPSDYEVAKNEFDAEITVVIKNGSGDKKKVTEDTSNEIEKTSVIKTGDPINKNIVITVDISGSMLNCCSHDEKEDWRTYRYDRDFVTPGGYNDVYYGGDGYKYSACPYAGHYYKVSETWIDGHYEGTGRNKKWISGHYEIQWAKCTDKSRIDVVKESLSAFVDTMYSASVANNEKITITLVTFNGTALSEKTYLLNSANVTTLKSIVSSIYATGGTEIDDGISEATCVFDRPDMINEGKVENYSVFFGDGEPSSNDDINYDDLKDAVDYSYAIGFGPDFENTSSDAYDILDNMIKGDGISVTQASSANDVMAAFASIAEKIASSKQSVNGDIEITVPADGKYYPITATYNNEGTTTTLFTITKVSELVENDITVDGTALTWNISGTKYSAYEGLSIKVGDSEAAEEVQTLEMPRTFMMATPEIKITEEAVVEKTAEEIVEEAAKKTAEEEAAKKAAEEAAAKKLAEEEAAKKAAEEAAAKKLAEEAAAKKAAEEAAVKKAAEEAASNKTIQEESTTETSVGNVDAQVENQPIVEAPAETTAPAEPQE